MMWVVILVGVLCYLVMAFITGTICWLVYESEDNTPEEDAKAWRDLWLESLLWPRVFGVIIGDIVQGVVYDLKTRVQERRD